MSEKNSVVANSYIANLIPYQPGKPVEEVVEELGIQSIIKMASNENVLGASLLATNAIQSSLDNIHIYPNGAFLDFKKALSNFLSVKENQILIGNGSENILEIIIKTFLSPYDEAIISQYCFLTIPILIKSCGADVVTVPTNNFVCDIDNIINSVNEKTRIVFIVNPNNPTGSYTSQNKLEHLLNSIPKNILIVIDEAYYEYAEKEDYPDTVKLLEKHSNLVITRTFSKAYGLAALRLGYAIASPDITDLLNRARLPFNVNSIAMAAGKAALLDQDHIQKTRLMNQKGMKQIEMRLQKLNIDYIPSLGNFITIKIKPNAKEIFEKLLTHGVIVRPLTAYDLPNYIRVTIGTYEQNERFLKTFESIL